MDIAPAQPAVFVDTSVSATRDRGAESGRSQIQAEARPGSPARAGDVLVIFCAGLGAVIPAIAEVRIAGAALSNTVNPVQLNVGGASVAPFFAGLTPGFVGLYQVNATLPSGLAAGDAIPLTIGVAGQTSPVVTIAVQ